MAIPPISGNQFRDFSKHLLEKKPDGVTLKDVQYHIEHHSPGADKDDPVKFGSALFVMQKFNQIDGNKDQKLTSTELNKFAASLPPGPPPPPEKK